MKACVNQEVCIGCGLCTAIASDVFTLGASGKAEAVAEATDVEAVRQAMETCPVGAIREE